MKENFIRHLAGAFGLFLVIYAINNSALPGSAKEYLSEDYNSTKIGDLPASHSVIYGTVSAKNDAQSDGTSGGVLAAESGSGVKFDNINLSDVSVEVELKDFGNSAYVGIRMSPDSRNGYLLLHDVSGGFMSLYRVDDGIRRFLGQAGIGSNQNGWNKIYFEARGSEIRAVADKGGDMRSGEIKVIDSAYASGFVVLGKDAGRGGEAAQFDNLVIKSPEILSDFGDSLLPASFGFEDSELVYIDKILQHPNIRLVAGGYGYLRAVQRDSNEGNALVLSSGSLVKFGTKPLADASLSVEIRDESQSGFIGLRMSSDGKNGYQLLYDSYAGHMTLYKLTNGVRIPLGKTSAFSGRDGWNLVYLEARGSEIRAAVEKGGAVLGGEIIVRDEAHKSGYLMLGKDVGRGFGLTRFDNVLFKSPNTLSRATAAALPFLAKFDDAELVNRNFIIQHRNLDLIKGGYNILTAPQRDGSAGDVLSVGEGGLVALSSGVLGNLSIQTDINDANQSGFIGFRMSPDGDDGYLVSYDLAGGLLSVYRVDNGVRTELGQIVFNQSKNGWNRISITAVGGELKASLLGLVYKTEVVVSDSIYSGGYVFFGKDAGRGSEAAKFDNIAIGEALISADTDGDGLNDATDICPDKAGKLEYGGCPLAYNVGAVVDTTDSQKAGLCGLGADGKPRGECKLPAAGGIVRVFDVDDPSFRSNFGEKPLPESFGVIFETRVGRIAECLMGGAENCFAGIARFKNALIILKYQDGSEIIYAGKFDKSEDKDGDGDIEVSLKIFKTIRLDGSVELK